MRKLKKFAQHIVHLLYPRKCIVCDKIIKPDKFLCEDCVKFEIYTNKKCRGCSGKKCSCNLKDYVYDDCIAAKLAKLIRNFNSGVNFLLANISPTKLLKFFLKN